MNIILLFFGAKTTNTRPKMSQNHPKLLN